MKLVAMLRIKDQILTIRDCLDRLQDLVDEVVIVDNGSTDGTLEVYANYPMIKMIEKTQGYHEGRDKILLLDMAKKRNPDWILWIDADEIIEKDLTRKKIDKMIKSHPEVVAIWFRLYHFWIDKKHFRVDGPWHKYTAFPQRMMWRNQESAYFRNMKMHNGGIMGLRGAQITAPYRIKHYGYAFEKLLKTKEVTYGRMKDDPRASKTMPMSQDGMIRLPFWSQTRLIEYYYWNVAQFVHHYVNILKMKFIK